MIQSRTSIFAMLAALLSTLTAVVASEEESQHHIRRALESAEPDIQFAGSRVDNTQSIVNGDRANATEVPWFVHFGDGSCGASLISKNRVLTAAHCVYQPGPPDFVRVATSATSNGRRVDVACATVHPDYDNAIGNDVAILKVKSV
jgi:secreted trypsin-like serine protease